jgi:hypothetical protein
LEYQIRLYDRGLAGSFNYKSKENQRRNDQETLIKLVLLLLTTVKQQTGKFQVPQPLHIQDHQFIKKKLP